MKTASLDSHAFSNILQQNNFLKIENVEMNKLETIEIKEFEENMIDTNKTLVTKENKEDDIL